MACIEFQENPTLNFLKILATTKYRQFYNINGNTFCLNKQNLCSSNFTGFLTAAVDTPRNFLILQIKQDLYESIKVCYFCVQFLLGFRNGTEDFAELIKYWVSNTIENVFWGQF